MNSRLLRIISAVMLCLSLLLIPVFSLAATTKKVDPKEGFPYNDHENFRYRVENHPEIASGWTGSDYVLAYRITVWDITTIIPRILSTDDYVITFKNLPKPENTDDDTTFILRDEENTYQKKIVYYKTSFDISASGLTGDPVESWEMLTSHENSSSDNSTSTNDSREETLGSHKARFGESELVYSINNNNRYVTFSQYGGGTVQLEDIPFPSRVLYLNISWSATCLYYLGTYWDNEKGTLTDESNIPEAEELYENALQQAKAYITNFASLSYEIKKTPHLTEEGKGYTIIITKASQEKGETETSVPALIVLGVAGLAAAVAGAAGAAGAGANSRQSDEKQISSYKMYIRKEFKNKIRYDKPAVTVYARMAEITPTGEEIDRTDLTQQISITSNDAHMVVGQAVSAGNYVGATVEAQSKKGQENPAKGTVSFKFTGEGGSFQNEVEFDLVLEPYISFGKKNGNTVAVIEGDGGHYESAFELVDFTEVPKVTVKPLAQNHPFEIEAVRINDFAYKLEIENQTISNKNSGEKPKKPSYSFYKFELFAENEVESARTMVEVNVYPEGIVVRNVEFDDNGYALIRAFADIERSEAGEEVLATRLIVELAVGTVDEQGRRTTELVDVSKTDFKIGDLDGTDQYTKNLAKAFEYEIEDAGKGAYKFQPKMQIPEGENPYYMTLPMSCSYNNVDYKLDFSVRLVGEPFDEIKSKQEELRLLLYRVRRYMPPEEWQSVVQFFKDRFDYMSVREIRLMNKSLVEASRYTLTKQGESLRNFADKLDWVIDGLEWVKWIGDQAFSYLMDYYFGPVGEALLVPAKDILVVLLADYAGQIWYDEKTALTEEQMQTQVLTGVMTAVENLLMSNIDTKNINMKKIGGILAAFAVLKFLNHYFNDKTPDGKDIELYDALMLTFSDLTTNVFKMILQKKFEEFVNNENVKAIYEKYCKDWVSKSLGGIFDDLQENSISIIQKYVTEMFGAYCAQVYGEMLDKAGKSTIKIDSGDLIITIPLHEFEEEGKAPIMLDINVTKAREKIIDYIYKTMFSMFPFPESTMPVPNDPPYFPATK